MRTTVTLDSDVARLLKDEAHRMHKSFKKTLNDAVRTALSVPAVEQQAPFKVDAAAMGLRAGIDPGDLSHQADQYDVDGFLRTTRRLMVAEDSDDRT
jgi:hypothetical protein